VRFSFIFSSFLAKTWTPAQKSWSKSAFEGTIIDAPRVLSSLLNIQERRGLPAGIGMPDYQFMHGNGFNIEQKFIFSRNLFAGERGFSGYWSPIFAFF